MNTASLNLFYASAEFTEFENEYVDGVGTNPAKLGDCYKGILRNSLTPLEHYLVDTFHCKIIIANIVMRQLVIPLAQDIEDIHPGKGVWALSAACKPAGLHHLGERILKYALATKKIFFSDCQASENVQTQEALPRTTRVVKFYIDHYVPKLNLQDLCLMVKRLNPALTEMVNRKGRGKLDKAAMHVERGFVPFVTVGSS